MPVGREKCFDLVKDDMSEICLCPACKEYLDPETCGFANCWYSFSGAKKVKGKLIPVPK